MVCIGWGCEREQFQFWLAKVLNTLKNNRARQQSGQRHLLIFFFVCAYLYEYIWHSFSEGTYSCMDSTSTALKCSCNYFEAVGSF